MGRLGKLSLTRSHVAKPKRKYEVENTLKIDEYLFLRKCGHTGVLNISIVCLKSPSRCSV